MYIHITRVAKSWKLTGNFGTFPEYLENYRKCSTPLQPYTQHIISEGQKKTFHKATVRINKKFVCIQIIRPAKTECVNNKT